jgi:hypothetical protein
MSVVTRPAPRAYFTNALLHPANIMAALGVVCFALVAASPIVLGVAVLVELAYLRWVPSFGWFRRSVDRQIEAATERQQLRTREALRAQLDESRRRKVYELEALAERVRDARRYGVLSGPHADVDPFELIDSYMTLAVAKQGYEQLLAKVGREALTQEVGRLEESLGASSTPHVRRIRERRLSIVCQRAALWDHTWQEVERIANLLAAIEDVVELLHEQSLAVLTPSATTEHVDGLLTEIEDREVIRRELARLVPEATPARALSSSARTTMS